MNIYFRLLCVLTLLVVLPSAGIAQAATDPAPTVQSGDWQCWTLPGGVPCNRPMDAVAFTSSTDGWAVGGSGTMLHWNGSDWRQVTGPTTDDLFSVAMVSADDGWAVGDKILHWDGNEWSQLAIHLRLHYVLWQ